MSDQEGERENLAIGTLSVNQRAIGSEFRKMDLDSPGASGVIIVRFGSQADVKRHPSRCLLSGVKRT